MDPKASVLPATPPRVPHFSQKFPEKNISNIVFEFMCLSSLICQQRAGQLDTPANNKIPREGENTAVLSNVIMYQCYRYVDRWSHVERQVYTVGQRPPRRTTARVRNIVCHVSRRDSLRLQRSNRRFVEKHHVIATVVRRHEDRCGRVDIILRGFHPTSVTSQYRRVVL